MEEYVLETVAASAEAVVGGAGALVRAVILMFTELTGITGLDEMERAAAERGRELTRLAMQSALDGQAAAEVRLAAVTGADGLVRRRAEAGHVRTVTTTVGKVAVRRLGYRSARKGVPALFPRDGVLGLPPCGYSWPLQRLAQMLCRSVSYGQARELVAAATGISIGRRQLEQITMAAAADAEQFCQDRDRVVVPAAGEGQEEAGLLPLAISADGKGVAMRPEARRRRTLAPGQRSRNFDKRRGTGEKGHKRMAETGCVFDVAPPDPGGPQRTAEHVMCRQDGAAANGPRAVSRWYACDITAGRDVTIGRLFDEADRRDPGHLRTWIALVDGDIHQLGLIRGQAAARGVTLVILIDFIHVLEYLWKAAWCFHAPRDPAMEGWVTEQGLDILHGRAPQVISRIRQLAEDHPPRPGSEHARIIRKTLHYLEAKQPWMDYPKALASGWPIATGVIEGACRHLVNDRMGITGARWGLEGAQAILWLRALHASGDHDTYWNYHLRQEHQRNHLSRYQHGLGLAA